MYLRKKGGFSFILTAIPCVLMLILTGWAMILNEKTFYAQKNWLLVSIGLFVFILAAWMTIETAFLFIKKRR